MVSRNHAEIAATPYSISRCVRGEDVVVIFRRYVAGEAGLVQRLVARLSVLEISEPPAAGGGVLL